MAEQNQRRRHTDRAIPTRIWGGLKAANDWLARSPLAAYIVVLGLAVFAVWQIEAERAARAKVAGEIFLFNCEDNNAQDATLAALVEVSMGGQEFGAKAEPQLTAFQIKVVDAIQAVQEIEAEQQDDLRTEFKSALTALRAERQCEEIKDAFLAGEPLPEEALSGTSVETSEETEAREDRAEETGE